METAPYILTDFKPFSLRTTVAEVKSLFNETTFSHFPIVRNNKIIGIISENDIRVIEDNDADLESVHHLFVLFTIKESNNILEIIQAFVNKKTNLFPVIDSNNNYIGYFDLMDILQLYKSSPFINNEGTFLLLEKEIGDFSFSEICQIIESNNGKVLGIFISENGASSTKITLKFSSQDVNEIIQSFRRYEYAVISNHNEDFYLEDLKDRSNYLKKYLNI